MSFTCIRCLFAFLLVCSGRRAARVGCAAQTRGQSHAGRAGGRRLQNRERSVAVVAPSRLSHVWSCRRLLPLECCDPWSPSPCRSRFCDAFSAHKRVVFVFVISSRLLLCQVLSQLQRIFATLENGASKFCDTSGFCANWKGDDVRKTSSVVDRIPALVLASFSCFLSRLSLASSCP